MGLVSPYKMNSGHNKYNIYGNIVQYIQLYNVAMWTELFNTVDKKQAMHTLTIKKTFEKPTFFQPGSQINCRLIILYE